MTKFDVAVIGAGLAGAATAWAASRRGMSVLLIEQFAVNHSRGSSHGSARIFRRAYADELYVRLTGAAGELWRELELDAGVELVRVTGGVDHGAVRSVEVIAELLGQAHVPFELLDDRAAEQRWPGMRFEGPVLFHPEAGVIDADGTVRACVELARGRGAVVWESTPVVGIDIADDEAVVRTAGETVTARRVVVAAGAWASQLLDGVIPVPPLEVSQQQIFHFARRDESIDWPTFVHKDALSTYGLPGGRDGGPGNPQKVAQHFGGQITTVDGRDFIVDPAARQRLIDYVTTWLPGLIPEPFNETTCLYTSTPDEDFVLDRIGPVVVSSACSGHGAKFAPWLGETAAALAADEKVDLARFALGRAGLATK